MKTKIISLVSLILFFCCSNLISQEATNKDNPAASGSITVYSTPELTDLTAQWAKEYGKSHPGQVVNVIPAKEPGLSSIPGSDGNICFVSNQFQIKEDQQMMFKVVVGREIIVPVINLKNPYLSQIQQQGISREAFAKSLEIPEKGQWGTLLNGKQNTPVSYYMLNDDQVRSSVAEFLNVDPGLFINMKSESGDAMIAAVQNDPYAIGFCRLTDILKTKSQAMVDNIQLLPIDKNGNGKLDYMENIYVNPTVFSRGVWIGKYPKALTSNIYSVAKALPENESEIAFLQWILTSGQSMLEDKGYSDLVSNERQSQLDRLFPASIAVETAETSNSPAKMILLILMAIIIISVTVDYFIRRNRKSAAGSKSGFAGHSEVFDENHVKIPGGLYFDKTHTWAFMEQDGTVKIGIDDFIQHVTGPITRVEMKKAGDKIRKGERLCSIIQNGKQLNLYAPVSGTIRSQNHALASNSGIINDSPYTDGWIYRIEPTNWLREISFLSMAEKYQTWLKGEFTRLKDFLAGSIQMSSSAYVHVVLQDGGELQDHVLADLEPFIWEEFQRKFIDVSK
jgi:glycine cleavage system H lipoate-binding protein/ABC-type phosphate transport system substrate-binding protein